MLTGRNERDQECEGSSWPWNTLVPGSAPGRRVPVCEHAYDLETATLAGHPAGSGPGWGFPSCQCGWNSQPQAVRCPRYEYITKPVSLDLFTEAIRQVDDFFLTLVKLPG